TRAPLAKAGELSIKSGQRASNNLPSAVMNALTFGLLITALSGFAQGQSLTLIGAELVVMVVVGIFFIRRQLSLPVPLLPVDLLRIPLFSLSSDDQLAS
ncbi:hypothetical protein AAIH58_37470, partial [Pseudomonas aeruginosa]